MQNFEKESENSKKNFKNGNFLDFLKFLTFLGQKKINNFFDFGPILVVSSLLSYKKFFSTKRLSYFICMRDFEKNIRDSCLIETYYMFFFL